MSNRAEADRQDEKKTLPPKRHLMAVGVRRAGGSWWIQSRLRTEPAKATPARPSLDDRAA
ncbi:MAG: hypothetical protein FJ144_02395 [Deltaproteobacteria bacterium]|nr:hypothetical protein [Deltaproteobacteria bacterium]